MVESKAQILGHPLHPMLIVFPTALYPLALVFDLVWLVTGELFWLSASFWTLVAGVVMTLAAAVPGLIDYASVVPKSGNARRTANFHLANGLAIAVLNIIGLGLRYGAGAYTYGLQPVDFNVGLVYWAIGLNALGNLLLIAQGWWGGELVYRHRIGVEDVPASQKDARGVPGEGGPRQPRPGGGSP